MTSETTETVTITENEEQSEGSRLREERNRMKAERDTYREEVLRMRLEKMGLNPDEGLGVAVMDNYDGAPSVDALATHLAEKYKYEIPAEIVTEKVTEPAKRIAQVNQESTPVEPEQTPDPVRQAESKMSDPASGREEAQASLAAKMQRYRQNRPQP